MIGSIVVPVLSFKRFAFVFLCFAFFSSNYPDNCGYSLLRSNSGS